MPTNQTITDAALAELDRLKLRITKGIWKLTALGFIDAGRAVKSKQVCRCERNQDAQYILALHNAYPALRERLRMAEAENARLCAGIRAWIETRDDTSLVEACDAVPRTTAWLAARDARLKREGSAMKLLEMSLGDLAWDSTDLRHEAESMIGNETEYQSMLATAKRLRGWK